VDDAQQLVSYAAVFAYPSIYEGFGLPPLEAMALGVPVVATAAGSLPEVLGDAALLVPPGEPDALAEALDKALTDRATRERLVRGGLARSSSFSWQASGIAMEAVYRELASQ
jgi:alpha-1,3-rhamnosyl/mannosyltransferase